MWRLKDQTERRSRGGKTSLVSNLTGIFYPSVVRMLLFYSFSAFNTVLNIKVKFCTNKYRWDNTDVIVLHCLWEFTMDKNMIVFCFHSSWKAKKKLKKRIKRRCKRKKKSSCDCFRWTMTFRNNTAQYTLVVFYFTFSHLVSEQNKTNKRTKKKKRDWRRAVLFKSDLWIVCFNGCAARNAGRWGIMRWTHIWRRLRAWCTVADPRVPPVISGRQLSCYFLL